MSIPIIVNNEHSQDIRIDQTDLNNDKEVKSTEGNGKNTPIDHSIFENIVNNEKIDEGSSSRKKLDETNKLTDDVRTDEIVTEITGKEPKILTISDLPEHVQKLINTGEDLQNRFSTAKTIKDKLALLPQIRSTFDELVQALNSIDPKFDSESFLTDKIVDMGFVLIDIEDSADAISQLKKEVRLFNDILDDIKTEFTNPEEYAELCEYIDQCEELLPKDRKEVLELVNKHLQTRIEFELQSDKKISEILSKGTQGPSQDEVIKAAAGILARIRIANPYMQDKININALLRIFIHSRTLEDLPRKDGRIDEDYLVSAFKTALVELANVSDPKNDDAMSFCKAVDRFTGNRLEHFAAIGELLKSSLAPNDTVRTVALAQQEFRVSLKTLLMQVPQKKLAKLGNVDFTQVLTFEGIDALTKLPKFNDIANHVAYLVMLQGELIRNGAIDIHEVVKGNSRYTDMELDPKDPIALQNLKEEIAFEQIKNFAKKVKNEDVENLVMSCKDKPLFKEGSTTELNPVHQMLLGKLNEMSQDYVKRSIQGEKDEKKITDTLQSVGNKLTGTYFSENYLKKVYDLNIDIKKARILDGVFRELTGVLDPVQRNLIKPEDRDIVGTLAKETEKTLHGAVEEDSTSNLKKSVDRKKAAKTLEELLFDREAAKKNGFDFERLDKNTKKVLEEQAEAYNSIQGTRRRVIESLKHEADFAFQNGQAVRLHLRKKNINAVVKENKANADKVFTCFWNWKTRKANVGKILHLAELKNSLDILNHAEEDRFRTENEERRRVLVNEIEKLYSELKDLNLANLAKHNSKENLNLDEFLERAVPLAKAIDYMRISKKVKIDIAKIKELKSRRNEARKAAKSYLKEAKAAYGKEVVRQIRRTVVMAAYMVDRNHGSEPMSFNNRMNETIDFLKKNIDSMKHCDEGILGLIVKETLRRYTPPKGPMSHKYLDRIEKELGSAGKDSQRLRSEEKLVSKTDIKNYKTSAMRMYLDRGAEGLMSMIDKPGRGFMYSKKTSFTLSTMPALMQASFSYMPSESFCVSNTGDGYRVLVKSDHAVEIAASAGFRFKHEGVMKNLGTVSLEVKAKIAGKLGKGLEFKFKTGEDAQAFIKDFMNPGSPLHSGKLYNPTWHTSEDIRFIRDYAISGGIDVTAKAALCRYIGNDTYANQLHFGSEQDFSQIEDFGGYLEALGPSESGNKYSKLSVTLPSVKLGFGFMGGGTRFVSTNRNTTLIRTSKKMRIEAEVQLSSVKLMHTFKPLYKAIWEPLANFLTSKKDDKDSLIGMIVTAFSQAGLDGEQERLVQDKLGAALHFAQQGEVDQANALLKESFGYLVGPALDKFIGLETDDRHLKNIQQLAKVFLFEHKASHIGFIKAGQKKDGIITDVGNVKVGVNLDVGPLGLTKQVISNAIKNSSADEKLTPNSKEKSVVDSVKPYLAKTGQYADVIYNVLLGDPTLAAANIIGNIVGEHTFENKSRYRNVSASINAKDGVKFSDEKRKQNTEAHIDAGLTKGFSMGGAINFFGTCDTEHVSFYDHVKHQYTSETGIDYKITKSKFSLENLLEVLHLPKELGDELAGNETLMKSILKAFVCAGPKDVFTLKTQIKPNVLKEINMLELQKSLHPKRVSKLQSKIDGLVSDPNNYVPVDISVTHNDVRELRLAFEMSDINLGVFAFSHHRELVNTKSTTVSLRSLESVQKIFGTVPQNEVDDVNIDEHESEDVDTETEPKSEEFVENNTGKKSEQKNTDEVIDTSKKSTESDEEEIIIETKPNNVYAKNDNSGSENIFGAVDVPNPPQQKDVKYSQEWYDYAQAIQNFIRTNSATLFIDNDEALKRLLDKVKVLNNGSPDAFLLGLAQIRDKNEVRTRLVEKFMEICGEIESDNGFAENSRNAISDFNQQAIPNDLDTQSYEIHDYQERVRSRLADRNNYKVWMESEPNAERTGEAYLQWTVSAELSKIKSERNVQKFEQRAFIPTDTFPTVSNPVKVGQVFSQHTNTCFMMSVANALAATEKGTAYLNNWLQSNPSIDSDLKKNGFSTFEQQLATLYRNYLNTSNNNAKWKTLGEMGEADAMGLALNLDSPANFSGVSFNKETPDWKLRELWYDISKALHDGKITTLFTPNPRHYRAIVGTYGDPKTDDFGFIIRDSSGGRQYHTSVKNLAIGDDIKQIKILEIPASS